MSTLFKISNSTYISIVEKVLLCKRFPTFLVCAWEMFRTQAVQILTFAKLLFWCRFLITKHSYEERLFQKFISPWSRNTRSWHRKESLISRIWAVHLVRGDRLAKIWQWFFYCSVRRRKVKFCLITLQPIRTKFRFIVFFSVISSFA